MQWVQASSQSNVYNLNSVRCEASRHFRNKKKTYLKANIEELETSSKFKTVRDLCRGISDFKQSYQHRTNMVKDEKGDLVADSHSILARWRRYISQLLKVHGVNDVRQTEIHTAEPLIPEPSAFEFDLAIEKLKTHKSPGSDQIPTELITAGVEQFALISISILFLFGIRRNYLRSGRRQSYLSIRRAIKQCSNYRGISLLPIMYKIFSNILLSSLTPYAEEIIGDHQCGFRHNRSTNDHIFCICQILEKNGSVVKQRISSS